MPYLQISNSLQDVQYSLYKYIIIYYVIVINKIKIHGYHRNEHHLKGRAFYVKDYYVHKKCYKYRNMKKVNDV